MIEHVHLQDDPRLTPYRLVGDRAALERAGLFVAEGRLVAERLLEDARFSVHSVLVTHPAAEALRDVFEKRQTVAVYICTPDVMRGVTGFGFHRGCVALAHRPAEAMSSGPESLGALRDARCLLVLQGVTDPDNVGGLFRTALAFGVDAVILDRATADPLYRKAIRTSMAATLRLPWVRVDPWPDALESLRAGGRQLVALTPQADAVALADYAAAVDGRIALMVGSEGFGLDRPSLEHADVRVRIPVDPRADSLNVVTAAGIALHGLARFGGSA